MSLLLLSRWLHAMAAITWIGGMLFIALVLVPATRGIPDPALRARMVRDVGRRFRLVAWIALAILILTGVFQLWVHPFLLGSPRFQWKAGLVALSLVLSVIHDFVLGPRAGRPGAEAGMRLRATWVARANVLFVLAIVWLGLWLLR
jgi:uncharacterized membrane protein